MHISSRLAFALVLAIHVRNAQASVIEYSNKSQWQVAAGSYSTLTFQEFPLGTVLTDQLAGEGLHFTPGEVNVSEFFVNDGVGLNNGVPISVMFDAPRYAIGFDFPGGLRIELFNNKQLIHVSDIFGVGGTGFFGGVVSTDAFDEVKFYNPIGFNSAHIDDMFYGAPVPAPASALLLLGFAAIGRRRRR
jgi:hypothetical protein